jgi:hypothetical protein
VTRRIVSKAGSSNEPASINAAIITSPSAKESTSSETERRSGRPTRRLRTASRAMPLRASAASAIS